MLNFIINLFEWFLGPERFKNYIIDNYKKIALDRLDLKVEVKTVKKGKRKYDVAFFENKNGRIVADVGRHTDTN